jgi:HSP20 family molecular chaperone IbpA
MRKLLLVALLAQGAYLSANVDSVFKDIKEMMDGFNKRFKVVEEYMNTFPSFDSLSEDEKSETTAVSKKDVEILSEKEYCVVKLNLGDLDSEKINIEVENNSLKGIVPLADGEATFYVQNGRMFGLSFKKEAKKEQESEDEDGGLRMAKSTSASASTRVEALPEQVCDLENMIANYNNGVLELKLPKIPQKKGTKINVISKLQ